jgi:NAD(P)-dependent dehydrogenase (short-subunit alcohol dehydrogenase family)
MSMPVAVITGGAKGIGLEVARRLATTHRVALLDIDHETARTAATELGSDALALHCDIADSDSVTAAVQAVVDELGGIDVAVSNAGIGSGGVARHLDPDALAAQLEVNLTGNWRFIHACLPHLIYSKGYVLGVASAAAITAPPGESFYSASKAGLEALLNVVRVEVAHLGVGVGVAYPMFIDTPMVREMDHEQADIAHMRQKLPGPAGRTYPVSLAGDRIADGIRERATRVFVPSSLRWQFLLRGLLPPVLDMSFRRIAREVDRLTEAKVGERGSFSAAFNRRTLDDFDNAPPQPTDAPDPPAVSPPPA